MEEIKLGNEDRKNFIKGIRAENERSNKRLYKILWKIKGQLFTTEVDDLIKNRGGLPQIRISRKPLGIRLKDNRWRTITEIWIDQRQGPDGPEGEIYIEVKTRRWLKFHFN